MQQVKNHALLLVGDQFERPFELIAAVAAIRTKDIAGQTRRMHPHQHFVVLGDLAHHHGDVLLAGDIALVGVHPEFAVRRGQARGCQAAHVLLVLHPVVDDVGDRDDLQAMADGELIQVRQPGHGAVFVHDFADHGGRGHAGDGRQIDGRLGLAGTFENAAGAGSQGENVTGSQEIGGSSLRVDGHPDRFGSIVG